MAKPQRRTPGELHGFLLRIDGGLYNQLIDVANENGTTVQGYLIQLISAAVNPEHDDEDFEDTE